VLDSKALSAPWLQSQSGERTFIGDSCQIGRGPNNTVSLPSEKVSRRHAIVHAQGQNEFWLIDLGSANGTYLNGRRVGQPTRLSDSDIITIADYRFQFFHPEQSRPAETDTANKTIQEIRNLNLWMLVADVEAGTQIAQRTPEEAPRVMGRWLASSKQVIDENGGTINKFLGDGFFAYWIDKEGAPAAVAKTMNTFKQAQERTDPRFRVVVHYGKVFVGGAANMGEDSLMGNEVNFIFRMEKLAAKLGQQRLLTEAATKQLGPIIQTESAGSHPVASFEGEFPFFTF